MLIAFISGGGSIQDLLDLEEIIENDYGTAIKFANGIMICFGGDMGGTKLQEKEFYFPEKFKDVNSCSLSCSPKYNNYPNVTMTCYVTVQGSAYRVNPMVNGNWITEFQSFQYIAVGLWK